MPLRFRMLNVSGLTGYASGTTASSSFTWRFSRMWFVNWICYGPTVQAGKKSSSGSSVLSLTAGSDDASLIC
jgi:hypothetical protein